MPNLVTAKVLYNVTAAEPLMYADVFATINCEQLASFSPRLIWIQQQVAPGDGVEIIYTTPSDDPTAIDSSAIRGMLIVQNDQTIIIDATTTSLQTACNACCDGSGTVAPYYTSGVPAFVFPTTSPFCIASVDAGDSSAFETFNLRYLQQSQ